MTNTSTRTAIITGASGGIGRAVALRLARDGFGVVVNYAGNAAKAEGVVNEIKSAGGQAIAVQADVANATDVERLFKKTLDTFNRIDVVVNSAGIMPLGRIADGDMEVFDKVIATNLRGAFLVLRQAAQHVGEGGRIIALYRAAYWPSRFQPTVRTSRPRRVWRDLSTCSTTNYVAARSP